MVEGEAVSKIEEPKATMIPMMGDMQRLVTETVVKFCCVNLEGFRF